MSKLRLDFGCWDYDRMAAIISGEVKPKGIELNFLNMPVEETFFRQLRYREFHASELSLSSYTVTLNREDKPFVAIPVFPSRFFRHGSIYVNADSRIRTPQDLVGKRVGCPEYQMTAPVWIRGILSDEYGVKPESVTYFTGGQEEPNREEKIKLDLPPTFDVQPIGPGKTLAGMLAAGEIDALYTARKPSTYTGPGGPVVRLFENFKEVEADYFARTSIFPIMHTVALRRDFYEENRWVARALLDAFTLSKDLCLEGLGETAAMKSSLPWSVHGYEEAVSAMGRDFWPYGLEKNEKTLTAFLRYHHEQGLSKRLVDVEELFAPETLEGFVI
ncbi:ABC transporter substrate-binding protein [Pseudochelatococcus sp. B33]